MAIRDLNVLAVINVIVEKGKVLLIQETKEHDETWYFPAGQIDAGEDIFTAAIRETQEEAGILCEPQSLIEVQHISFQNSASPSGYETSIRLVISSKFIKGELKTLQEADEHSLQAQWFPLDEVESLNLRHKEEVVTVIAKFYDSQKSSEVPHLPSLSQMYKFIEF